MRRAPTDQKGRVRCAVYTRKSSEEGLEQDFNSLDAQREACEAFIVSQKHEGWTCLPAMYDDGGISGGTLERPALKRLFADIAAGAVDTVVVYKVDRLTRSLSDFAKIVDVFDRHGVSFVSVTQQFNTTTSMGRLTLNMLLSFAQFEREVAGERIRDKIAASKKRGMWMGGNLPLGYDVKDRKLIVNPAEAETVRHIYRRYLALGSVFDLHDELRLTGVTSKQRVDRHGRRTGGRPLTRGALYLMLQNRIYRGEIVHKEASYKGEHEAIVDEALWDAVQRTLATNRIERTTGARAGRPSLLAGLIYDDTGERMTPSHANKKGTRYRYYVSKGLIRGTRTSAPRGRRVPAGDLEGLVESRLRAFLQDPAAVYNACEPLAGDASERTELVARAADLGRRWPDLSSAEKRAVLVALVHRIELTRATVEIALLPARLPMILRTPEHLHLPQTKDDGDATVVLSVPARLKRAGIEMKFLIDGADTRRKTDHSLRRLLAQAYQYNQIIMGGGGKSMSTLAAEAGVGRSYFTRILRLSFLAPGIVKTIFDDRHPLALTAKQISRNTRLAIAWTEQRALLAGD
jgi:DNA invertase Pin-like site-specific DNA recombinase